MRKKERRKERAGRRKMRKEEQKEGRERSKMKEKEGEKKGERRRFFLDSYAVAFVVVIILPPFLKLKEVSFLDLGIHLIGRSCVSSTGQPVRVQTSFIKPNFQLPEVGS